jgi:hypothetical protein
MTTHLEPEYQRLLAAWEQAEMIPGVNPSYSRKDRAGRVMLWDDYNKAVSRYGWTTAVMPASPQKAGRKCEEALHFKSEKMPTVTDKHRSDKW